MDYDYDDDYDEITGHEYPENFAVNHFMVYTDHGMLNNIIPNIECARRLAADSIRGGGSAIIFKTVEMWRDKGATFEQVELKEWP